MHMKVDGCWKWIMSISYTATLGKGSPRFWYIALIGTTTRNTTTGHRGRAANQFQKAIGFHCIFFCFAWQVGITSQFPKLCNMHVIVILRLQHVLRLAWLIVPLVWIPKVSLANFPMNIPSWVPNTVRVTLSTSMRHTSGPTNGNNLNHSP